MQRIGGLLFVAALATPFAVITLVGKPTETALLATEAEIPEFDQAALVAPAPTDMVALAAAAVGPVSVLRPGGEETAPLPPAAEPEDGPEKTALPVEKPTKPDAAPTPGTPDVAAADGTVRTGEKMGAALAPRNVPALARDTGQEGTRLPLSIATENAQATEEGLELDQAARRDLQVRLSLLGHEPGLFDGILGKQTRSAIAAAQAQLDRQGTGYVDSAFIALVRDLTEEKMVAYRIDQRRRSKQARLAISRRRSAEAHVHLPAAKNSPECLRGTDGRIKQNQSVPCDVSLLEESLKPPTFAEDPTGDIVTVQRPNTRQPISRR